MPATLYRRQRQIVEFISQYIAQHSCAPTLREIADAMEVSSLATVHEHIQTLIKKGVLKKYTGSVRGLEVVEANWHPETAGVNLPILGYIAAGQPIEPYTDPNASFSVSPTMVSGKKRSALLENGLATLKRFFKEATRIRLEPANSQMSPIYATNVRIQGKCVGVIRKFKPVN
ncbi:MAG: transcriptional repressor LexA [candidate division WWE3 bacterium GW2011_GWB1_44_4]|uniref:Transcriptional repressor LexA n=1 Tax=candidate division WWE3 bacterium GW2011_GWB1_44_4 TaxID=1619116 RepID=A0A0G1JBQ7_UNCKA|nr:MAG: transcriptional repressor LexA [candidate division WWE3 bacterium GW2011_GWB1_44_4]